MMTTHDFIAALVNTLTILVSLVTLIVLFILPTTNDSLDGVFSSGNITQSRKESAFSKIKTISGWVLIIVWVATCYLAWYIQR